MKSLKRIAWFSAMGVLLAGCATSPTFLNAQSQISKDEAALYRDILIEAVFIFLLIIVPLIFILVRGGQRGKEKALAPQIYGKFSWALAAGILVLVADGVDFGMLATTMHKVAIPAPAAQDLNVHVIGHRWWWEFDYPDQNFKTANEMHIPVGTNVQITLDSVDVIHSFWAPQLTGKTDAIPGQTNHMWLRADSPGTYYGQCSEFCGTEHALMRLRVIAQTPEDFAAWVADQQKPAATPQTADEIAGQKVVTTTCSTCHSIDPAEPRTDMVGPNLAHLQSRSWFAGATFELNDANLESWVKDTQAMKPGNDMNINLPADQLQAVLAYLKILK